MTSSSGSGQSAVRMFSILEVLSNYPKGVCLQEISAQCKLAKSTTHRILNNLIELGYVAQDTFTLHYRLTLKMFELSSRVVNDMDILSIAKPHLDRLSHLSGEAVHLVVQDGCDVVYIYKADSGVSYSHMSSYVGLRIPMYCSGVGKAILSTQNEAEVRQVWSQSRIRARTEYTVTQWDAFAAQLQETRRNGYALDNEENELGIRCIAFALPGINGHADTAFSISGIAVRLTGSALERAVELGLATRQDIMRSMGN